MNLPPDLEDFVRLLNGHSVEYVIIGGYAVAYHGWPRATGDLDVLIRSTAENASRLLDAIREFGFGELDLTVEDFTRPDYVVQIGFPPQRIDLITGIDGAPVEEVFARRIAVDTPLGTVYFISRDDLIRNKRAANRPRDIADIEALEPQVRKPRHKRDRDKT